MKDLAIYGAGGLGKEIASLVERINKAEAQWNLIGFFDDGKEKGTLVSHYGPIHGGVEELNNWPRPLGIAIAIGHPQTLRTVRQRIINPNISFPNLISPWLTYADKSSVSMGEGNIIQGTCWISNDATIGNFNIMNSEIVIGHDVVIGNFNVLMPDARLSGEVTLGEANLIGVGSIILQQIHIGNDVVIGPGAVMMTKPKDGCTYIGNPAKRFRFK